MFHFTPCTRGKVDPGPDSDNERPEAIWSHSLKEQNIKGLHVVRCLVFTVNIGEEQKKGLCCS